MFEQDPMQLVMRRCLHCHTPKHAHDASGRCPVPYRPGSLDEAQAALARARARHDQAAEFVARGEVQRLGGDPDAQE